MDLAKLAQANGGHMTWAFSQTDLSVWRHYRTGGICAALSAEWIKHHADEGSLVNALGGGGLGSINVGKLKEIAMLHFTASSDGGEVQSTKLGEWLELHGLRSLQASYSRSVHSARAGRSISQGMSKPAQSSGEGGCPNIEFDLVNAMKKYNTCYARVNFRGTFLGMGAGHAVAVWLGQPTYSSKGDAMLFDPNHGEYWFENKERFFEFFPAFYRATYRSFPFSFNKSWDVIPCAKKV